MSIWQPGITLALPSACINEVAVVKLEWLGQECPPCGLPTHITRLSSYISSSRSFAREYHRVWLTLAYDGVRLDGYFACLPRQGALR